MFFSQKCIKHFDLNISNFCSIDFYYWISIIFVLLLVHFGVISCKDFRFNEGGEVWWNKNFNVNKFIERIFGGFWYEIKFSKF